MSKLRFVSILSIAMAVSLLAGTLWAQAPKAKRPPKAADDTDDASGAAAKKPPAKPAGGAGKGKPKAADEDLPTANLEDPAVVALLATKPATPAECVRAAKLLQELKRPDLAKGFLQKVLDAQLDAKQWAALGEEFGSAVFVEFSSRPELQPEGGRLANAVLAASSARARDPSRAAGLIQDLNSASDEKRYRALLGLKDLRGDAVAPLVAVLADQKRADLHTVVRSVLVQLGAGAVGPLVAMLDSPDPAGVAAAAGALADLGAGDAGPFLWALCFSDQGNGEVRKAAEAALGKLAGKAPARPEAVRLLADEAQAYFNLRRGVKADLWGRTEVWFWDEGRKAPVSKEYSADGARLMRAVRFARQAFGLAPEDPQVRLICLATALEAEAYQNGLDKPPSTDKNSAAAWAAEFDTKTLERLLCYAIEHHHIPVAAVAARLLGRRPGAESLLHSGAGLSPLVSATRHPDRRLRLAAAEAIVEMRPAGPFPGSSYVVQALRHLAATRGTSRALIGGPRADESRRIAGYLAKLGYDADLAAFGQDVIRMGMESPDYEFILVDAGIDRPTVDFLLQQLRRDGRTADLPVGILAAGDLFARAQSAVRSDPRAEAFPRPHDAETVRWQIDRLLDLAGRYRTTFAERQKQANRAMQLLTSLSEQPGQSAIYDLSGVEKTGLTALATRDLTTNAAVLLGALGTPESQSALLELASRPTEPLAVRQVAVVELQKAVTRHGILLTTAQIRRQYERYNQSANLDAGTQKVLGTVLDILEAPTQSAKQAKSGPGREKAKTVRGKDS